MGYTVDEAIEAIGLGPAHLFLWCVCGMMVVSDAIEMMLLSYVGPTVRCEWHLSDGDDSWFTTYVFVGFALGSPCWGFLSDRLGRTRTMVIAAAYTCTFGVLSALAQDFGALCFLRAATGFGLAAISVAADFFLEQIPKASRGRVFAAYQLWWSVGAIGTSVMAWVVLPSLGWRWLVAFSSVPLAVTGLVMATVGDSPRALAARGLQAEATEALETLARYNGTSLPEGVLEVSNNQDESSQGLTFSAAVAAMCSGDLGVTTAKLAFIYMATAFVYFGSVLLPTEIAAASHDDAGCSIMEAGGKSPFNDDDFTATLATATAEIPGILFVIAFVDVIGRRNCILAQFGVLASGFALLCVPGLEGAMQDVLVGVVRAGSVGLWPSVWLYSREIYPTSYRSTASGLLNGFARIGGMAAPLVVQYGFQVGYAGVAFGSLFTVAALAVLAAFSLTDTTGTELDVDVAGSGSSAPEKQLQPSTASTETSNLIEGAKSKSSMASAGGGE